LDFFVLGTCPCDRTRTSAAIITARLRDVAAGVLTENQKSEVDDDNGVLQHSASLATFAVGIALGAVLFSKSV
jgi:hypothetical protein